MTKAGAGGSAAAAALSWREATDRLKTEGRQAFGPSELVTAQQPTKTVRPSPPPPLLLPLLLLDPVPKLLPPTWKSLFRYCRKPTTHLQLILFKKKQKKQDRECKNE